MNRYEATIEYLRQRGIQLTPTQDKVLRDICELLSTLPIGGGKTVLLEALLESDK